MRARLRRYRRRWCAWRGHEMVKHELCLSYKSADEMVDGVVIPGEEVEVWSVRCAKHN